MKKDTILAPGLSSWHRVTLPGLKWLLLTLGFAVQIIPLSAAAPVLKALEPRGGQRGKAFTLMLVGEGLTTGAEVSTTLPGSISRLAPSQDQAVPESELPLLVQLKEDAPVGLYPIRIRTDEGLSNVLLFSVGALPEIQELESALKLPTEKESKETNDSLSTAQKVTPPVIINGTLKGPDQDYYRFSATAGERLVFEVEARRAGSAIDPVIRVLDSAGREMALNNDAPGLGVDARTEVLFPEAGEYYVLVHDAKFSIQDQNFYRLKIGSFPYAEGIFPLGWQRGGRVEVSLFGGNLKAPVKVKPNLVVAADSKFLPLSLPASGVTGSLPFLFRISDLPETLEPAEASFSLQHAPVKGDVTEKSPVASSVPALPPSTVVNGRISRPGEVDKYRLSVSPGQPWVFEVEAAALGTSPLLGLLTLYDAESNKRLALADNGNAIYDPKTNKRLPLPSEGNRIDPRLSFTIPKDVKEIVVAVEDLLGRGGPNYGYRLLATQQASDFAIELLTPYINVPVSGTTAIEVRVERRGYDGPIHLTIPELPEDLLLEGGNVPAEFNPPLERRPVPAYVTLTAKPGAKLRTLQLSVWGEAVSSDNPIRRRASAPGIVTIVRGTKQKPVTAPWLEMDLPAAIAKSIPLTIEIPKHHVRLPQGMDHQIQWKLVKSAGMIPPLKVEPRPTAGIKDIRVLRKQGGPEYADEGAYNITTTFATPTVAFDIVLDGSRMSGGKVERVVTAPAVAIEIVQGYSLKLLSERIQVKRGGKFELAGTVDREPTFTGVVKIRAEDLPEHVACPEIVVPSEQADFRLVFEATPDAKPGEFEVRLTSSASIPERKDKQDYVIPDLKARLVVATETSIVQAPQ